MPAWALLLCSKQVCGVECMQQLQLGMAAEGDDFKDMPRMALAWMAASMRSTMVHAQIIQVIGLQLSVLTRKVIVQGGSCW